MSLQINEGTNPVPTRLDVDSLFSFWCQQDSKLEAELQLKHTLSLFSLSFIMKWVCSLAPSCWKIQDLSCQWRVNGSTWCTITCINLWALMFPFHMCKLSISEALKPTLTLRDAGISTYHSFFCLEDATSMLSRTK